jgi:hypothetical protein
MKNKKRIKVTMNDILINEPIFNEMFSIIAENLDYRETLVFISLLNEITKNSKIFKSFKEVFSSNSPN